MNHRRFAALGFLFCILANTAWGQTCTSRITGTVEDSTGAGQSGAKVVVMNEGTGVASATTSGAAGGYSFESMAPCAYTVRVESPGFKTFVSTGNVLTIGQPMTLNARLSGGGCERKDGGGGIDRNRADQHIGKLRQLGRSGRSCESAYRR